MLICTKNELKWDFILELLYQEATGQLDSVFGHHPERSIEDHDDIIDLLVSFSFLNDDIKFVEFSMGYHVLGFSVHISFFREDLANRTRAPALTAYKL